jgi:hypothetical protein
MNLPFKLKMPETIMGSTGAYHLHAKSEDGNKLFAQLTTVPCLGRKDGQTYNAVGLLVRFLFAGDEPKLPEGFEDRGKKAYKKADDESEVYAHQLNKMIIAVASVNVGSANLMEILPFHMEALAEIIAPMLEENGMSVVTGLQEIFETLNPGLLLPVVTFDPPKTMKSWQESMDEMKDAAKAGYKSKSELDKDKPQGGGDPDAE